MENILSAAIQLNAGSDKPKNIENATKLVTRAASKGAKLIALPEIFNWRGHKKETRYNCESIPGTTSKIMAELAASLKIFLLCGSIIERNPQGRKPFNTSILIDPQGKILACYRKLHLFKVPDATQFERGDITSYMCPGDTAFMGENKTFGAGITYFLIPSEKKEREPQKISDQTLTQGRRPEASASGVNIVIEDKDGKKAAEIKGTEEKGINRVYWDFRETSADDSEESGRSRYRRGGMEVLPGEYKVTISYGSLKETDSFQIKTDPRIDIDLDVLQKNYTMGKKAQKLTKTLTQANSRIEETQKTLKVIQQNLQSSENEKRNELLTEVENLEKKLNELSEILDPAPAKQGIADRSAGLRRQVMSAVWGIMGAGYRPITQASQVKYEKAITKLNEFLEKFNPFFQEDIKNFKNLLSESDFSLLKTYELLEIKKE